MKEFIKMTLAVMCGVFLMGILGFFLMFVMFAGMASVASTSGTTTLPRQGVLKIDMSKFVIGEQTKPSDAFSSIQSGGSIPTVGIWDAVQAVNTAAGDPGLQYIYLKPEGGVLGVGALHEFRQALNNFRKSGKAIVSYVEQPTTGSYYLASVADKVYMTSHSGGNSMLLGVSSQLFFLKDLLDKIGVNVQLIRHGKYKSAGEMFVKSEPSPENLEQNSVLVKSMWNTYAQEISKSRSLTPERLNEIIDNLELGEPVDFLRDSLADSLVTAEGLQVKLAELANVEKFDDVKMIAFADYVTAKTPLPSVKGSKIAVVYASGNIVDEEDNKNISGDRFSSILAKVRADSTVKAVVLRVNSPGGSVMASSKIKTEVDLLRAVKPVVASYGDYAASGGYWISNSCDYIYSDPTTLTGSIGVFGMVPDLSKTAKNVLKVNCVSVNSNKHGDMYTLMRPFDADEYAYMQKSIEDIYTQFVSAVSEGRDLKPEFVDSVAQGRVWTGADALKIGLVDGIGSLEDAIHYAARMASSTGEDDLSAWNIVSYPKPRTTMEELMEMFGMSTTDAVAAILNRPTPSDYFKGTPFEALARSFADWNPEKSSRVFARMPYEIVVK